MFTLNHNYIDGNNAIINKLILKLDANDYCFVQFMDDELFDNLIDLLKIIEM